MRLTGFSALALGFIACGCTSIEPLRPDIEARLLPSRLDEIAYINTLRGALEEDKNSNCYKGDTTFFRGELSQGYPHHTSAQEGIGRGSSDKCWKFRSDDVDEDDIRAYLDAGFGLASIYCQRFFVVANQSQVKREFQRDSASNLDTLVGTILSLSSAGNQATGIVNGAFGAVDSTYQSIDDAFLISPDLGSVKSLVIAAQRQHMRLTANDLPETYPGARQNIEDFAGYCTYSGMQALINASLAKQTENIADDEVDAASMSTLEAREALLEADPPE